MREPNYLVGLDIGTDSVGYAITNDRYELCRYRGEQMWGVNLFDAAQPAAKRRDHRVARRRLDRRQQRVQLVQELFAEQIAAVDADFFRRIQESYLYPEREEDRVRLFGTYAEQHRYAARYPTIHHLIVELMQSDEPHDVRLVYLACAWLVAHRGHFLSEVDRENVEGVTDFGTVYQALVDCITHDGHSLPWRSGVEPREIAQVLREKGGVKNKVKRLTALLFGEGGKAPSEIDGEREFNYACVINLLAGGKADLEKLYGREEYAELENHSLSLDIDEEKWSTLLLSLEDDDRELICCLKQIHDWGVLVNVLDDHTTLSEAKVAVYDRHRRDLQDLKRLIKTYLPKAYHSLFRAKDSGSKATYAAYVGKTNTGDERTRVKKAPSREEFDKYVKALLRPIRDTVSAEDRETYERVMARLEANEFMPKQVDGDNRVIPYQLYWHEMKRLLQRASGYLPFLAAADADGVTIVDKLLSVMEFRIPYYVGPLREASPSRGGKENHWMVRKAEGRILPWNFAQMVDLDRSEEAFIARMTNTCTYLPGEPVLPKCSLIYTAFEVLNEINNIKIGGQAITVGVKQELYTELFLRQVKVTPRHIQDYLISRGYMQEGDVLSGLDVTVKGSLRPFLCFQRMVQDGHLPQGYADAERIIHRATYSEDRGRFAEWLRREFVSLPEEDIRYISSLKFKEFGRLSRRLLCGIEGVNPDTGERMSLIRALWETNHNFMQLMTGPLFGYGDAVEQIVREHYGVERRSLSDRLDDMGVSPAVRRPIIRALDVMRDIVKAQGHAPERIFIEMARGEDAGKKGKRTDSRVKQLRMLYQKVGEEAHELLAQLNAWGDTADNRLQSDKLFLYFLQLGKCLYTGRPIALEAVLAGDGTYNIEHIYPRSVVKDDSVLNNKILVESTANGAKSDTYPVPADIQGRMRGYWEHLRHCGLLSDEKFRRLTRTAPFTEEERFAFINRQLVETRQSCRVVATLLRELYPDTELVYVRAGLVSEFRKQFELFKSRAVNDLHHARDAYLNIVAGSVWHFKFSRQFWRREEEHNAKVETVFSRPVIVAGRTVWQGAADLGRVKAIAVRNTAHVTIYPYCRHSGQNGGLFDQNPKSAAAGLIPLKAGRPTERYGGYQTSTVTFFTLVKYRVAGKWDAKVLPVELMYADHFLRDEQFALAYAGQKITEEEKRGSVEELQFPLGGRVLRIHTVLSFDGFRMGIMGKTGASLLVRCLTTFKTSPEWERYIKRLESFDDKRKKNPNLRCDAGHDGITPEQNAALYDLYVEKWQTPPYSRRPANPCDNLVRGRETFLSLPVEQQVPVLLAIQGLFGRAKEADLSAIKATPHAGVATLSSSLSKWKKKYKDVRILDQSPSGLFESCPLGNLLELI